MVKMDMSVLPHFLFSCVFKSTLFSVLRIWLLQANISMNTVDVHSHPDSLHVLMDRLPYRQKFLNDRNSKICYHSLKDHPKVSKIAKFRCEML